MKSWMIWGIVIAYWLWPFDLMPGNPVDDIVLVALTWKRHEIERWVKGSIANG